MLLLALAVGSCLSPAGLLDANRTATLAGPAPLVGTRTAEYRYSGQHLTGNVREKVDLASGNFVVEQQVGPEQEARGFDHHVPWMKDGSGFYLPEQGGDKPALAVNEAYRNGNAWWRADRGGATLASVDCNGVRVTPKGGKPFEAWFDPASHLLIRTREVQSFGDIVETRYSSFVRRDGVEVPTRVEITTNDDAKDIETLSLTSWRIEAARTAASYAMPSQQPNDWALPSGKVTVPFRLLNNHVIVDAEVNGRGPFPFLVDTGGHDIITPSTAAALGLVEQGSSQATGAGEQAASSGYATVERLQVGDAAMSHQTVTELDFSPADVEGLLLGGMIGVEFFERFVVEIDYGAGTLTFTDPAHFSAADRAKSGKAIPFRFYSHMPQVAGRLDGREVVFNIDTGSRVELTLTTPFVESAGLRAAYPGGVAITDGWGVGGPSRSYVVRAGELDLGGVKVLRPVVGLSSARRGSFSDANYQGNVGSGLLKRFVATFDYRGRTIYLRAAARQDPDIGAFDRVGMWLNRVADGFKIMDVAAGGPAEQGGLNVGDVVTAIGGVSVLGDSLSDVRRSLKLVTVGKPLSITALREREPRTVTVVPRDLIPQ